MILLSPFLLPAFAALLLPVLLHLWQKRHVVSTPFSTLRFLKAVASRSRRSAKFQDLFLFLLRFLIIAALVAAACRPVLPKNIARWFGAKTQRTVALVVDRSLSMSLSTGSGNRLDAAKTMAETVMDSLSPGDQVMVLSIGRTVDPLVAQPTADHALARRAIQSIKPSQEPTRFEDAFREVRQALARAPVGTKEMYLFTDNQEAGWVFDRNAMFNDAWKTTEIHALAVCPDDLNPANATLGKLKSGVPYVTAGGVVRGSVAVYNFGNNVFRDVLTISCGGKDVGKRTVEVAPNSSQEVGFDFIAPTTLDGRWATGGVRLSGDNLPADDRVDFVLPIATGSRVLVVETGNGPDRTRSGFFLRKALEIGRDCEMKSIAPEALSTEPLDGFSAVFLAGISGLEDRSTVRLERYLESGGTVFVFPGDATDADRMNRIEWLPVRMGKLTDLPAGRQAVFAKVPDHPVFVNSWSSENPFPALPQRRLVDLKPTKDARVLLTIADQPFLIAAARGAGQVFFLNASPDRSWGDFPLTASFLPLMKQVARLSGARGVGDTSFLVGDPVPAAGSLTSSGPLTLTLPDGSKKPVPKNAPQILDSIPFLGVYFLDSESEGTVHAFTARPDPDEGKPSPAPPAMLQDIPGLERVTGPAALQQWLGEQRGMTPLWPLLLLAALLLLVVEAIFANAAARQRSLGEAKHIATGRLNRRRAGQPFRQAGLNPTETEAQ